MTSSTTLFLLQNDIKNNTSKLIKGKSSVDRQVNESPLLCCAACNTPITNVSHCVEVNGAHEHVFTNPAGYTFHIVCYIQAENIILSSSPTMQDTWFSDYAWQFASCMNCNEQLGWYFSNNDSFYGFIQNRLIVGFGLH